MPLLTDVRTLFRRRSRAAATPTVTSPSTSADSTDVPIVTTTEKAASLLETKPSRSRNDQARNMDEVMGLVRKIGDHLELQSERTERLTTMLDRLPTALEALPEISRQNALLLDALHDHLEQSKGREDTLNSTLTTLTESSGRQTEVLGLIQQQVEANREATGHITATLGALQSALGDLAESNVRSAEVLQSLVAQTVEREDRVTEVLLRTQKWMVGFVAACGVASVLAIVVAAVAVLKG